MLQISRTVEQLTNLLDYKKDLQIGFVPTMGALHKGHISLIERALKENKLVICSIYVNPTQFNDPGDLARYPRMPETDARMLEEAGCDIIFLPSNGEIYKEGDTLLDIDLGTLEEVMEGEYRPGHFKGVVTVVDKLFRIIKPARAYFGEKDFQQLAVIREMTKQLQHPVTIIGCATLREPDGLAMSSRNMLLTPAQRAAAPLIYKTIAGVQELLKIKPISEIKQQVIFEINSNPLLKVQYFEIVDPDSLATISEMKTGMQARGCIAVITDGPRLIDNVLYSL